MHANRLQQRRFTSPAMADTADTANVIVRPPIAWALAVLAGLGLNWLMPLPFVPAAVSAGWLGAIVFALALALVAWAIAIITRAGSNVPTNLPTRPCWYRAVRLHRDWLKMKNANAPAVKRETEEDWGKEKWR